MITQKNTPGRNQGHSKNLDNTSLPDVVAHDYFQGISDGYAAGYEQGIRDGLAYGPAHPRVQQSVANFFGEWDGAEAARARSTARFHNEIGGGH